MNCTPEHKILTLNGYKEANKLKVGDLILSKYDTNHIDNIISPKLNKDQLQIINLYSKGLKYKEIAETLNISISKVSVTKSRAIQRMKT